MQKVSDEQVRDAYARTGSVWAAAKLLGVTGQTVSRRLKGETNRKWIDDAERDAIRRYYTETPPDQFDLGTLATRLGRTKQTVAKTAGELGLTDQSRRKSDAARALMKAAAADKWKTRPHPRGATGLVHSPDAKARMREASLKHWDYLHTLGAEALREKSEKAIQTRIKNRTEGARPNTYSRAKAGVREDLGPTRFRSRWEANYARYLNVLIKMNVVESWEYEPVTFWFEGIKRGVCSYKPDFRVKYRGESEPVFVEIKGWVQAKDRTKWRRMARYYPEVRLEIVAQKEMAAITRKWAGSIPAWERG